MLVTPLTQALGIEKPIVQGGMMWVGEAGLVAAVSEAGGLGILTGLTAGTPDKLREAIRKVRAVTKKPFGVNLTFMPSMVKPPYEELVDVIVKEGVRVVETAGGPLAFPYIKMLKAANIFVIHKCTSIRHAKSAVKGGVDMISVDGFECAGHPGEDDTGGLLLLALAAKQLNVPFIASGGIGDGRGLAGALALGAVGVNCGTLFMSTAESYIHPTIKQKMVDSNELDTTHIFRTMRNTARVYKNKIAVEVVAKEKEGAKFPEIAHLVAGARGRKVYEEGDVDAGIWWASPVMGLIDEVKTCQDLMDTMVKDAEDILLKIPSYVVREAKL